MTEPKSNAPVAMDKWIQKFLAHLATDRGASIYTQRNYRQALLEFARWHQDERATPPYCNGTIFGITCAFSDGAS
jgi:site-specific recombinase XerC